MLASCAGHANVLQSLIEAGGKVNLRDRGGMTALAGAERGRPADPIAALRQRGARP